MIIIMLLLSLWIEEVGPWGDTPFKGERIVLDGTIPTTDTSMLAYFADSTSMATVDNVVKYADSTLVFTVTPIPTSRLAFKYAYGIPCNISAKIEAQENTINRLLDFFMMLEFVNHSLTDSLLREVNATLYNYEGNAIAGYNYTKEK